MTTGEESKSFARLAQTLNMAPKSCLLQVWKRGKKQIYRQHIVSRTISVDN